MDPLVKETAKEFTQDVIFGIMFAMVAFLSCWRMVIYFDPFGGGKVITTFYGLLFGAAILRSIWFLIPKVFLEGSYVPLPSVAYQTLGWKGFLLSEILQSLGSLALYSVFILIICYWSHVLRKVENPPAREGSQLSAAQRSLSRNPRPQEQKRGPMQTFSIIMFILLIVEAINITLYLSQLYNSDVMILIDAIIIGSVSIVSLVEITVFSQRMRTILTHISEINLNSTKPQIRRILAVTVAANIFFVWRAVTESALVFLFLYLFRAQHSLDVILSSSFWGFYINAKHWSEIVVLSLALLISTAIRSNTASQNSSNSSSAATRVATRSDAQTQTVAGGRRTDYVRGSAGMSEAQPLLHQARTAAATRRV